MHHVTLSSLTAIGHTVSFLIQINASKRERERERKRKERIKVKRDEDERERERDRERETTMRHFLVNTHKQVVCISNTCQTGNCLEVNHPIV